MQPVDNLSYQLLTHGLGRLTLLEPADIPVKWEERWMDVVLYQPEIPQNTGNVGRTCLAVGAKLWLVRPLGFRVDEKSLRRAGLDYWKHLDWEVVDNWAALLERLPNARHWYFSKTARRPYTDVEFQPADVLVFGSETEGLPDSFRQEHEARTLRIPVLPPVRSLNLSSAVAVVVYELLRQCEQRTKMQPDQDRRV